MFDPILIVSLNALLGALTVPLFGFVIGMFVLDLLDYVKDEPIPSLFDAGFDPAPTARVVELPRTRMGDRLAAELTSPVEVFSGDSQDRRRAA
jgi:hypothetical protein